VEEKRNLSPDRRIKPFAFGLAFFEESAEKIIRACSSLSTFKNKTKKQENASQGSSLEVISENLSPSLFESGKQLKETTSRFEVPVLKNVKEIYAPSRNYSGKKASYKDNFVVGFNQKIQEYENLVGYQDESSEEIKTIFIKEVSTFKF
jgi:hypothetical protein